MNPVDETLAVSQNQGVTPFQDFLDLDFLDLDFLDLDFLDLDSLDLRIRILELL